MSLLLDAIVEDGLILPPPIETIGSDRFARREIWICLRTDGGSSLLFGDGTPENPYDGSSADKVDAILTSIFAGAHPVQYPIIRFGPATFETRGGFVTGWFAKNGRIIGSGMFVTTLKMIDVKTANELRALVAT